MTIYLPIYVIYISVCHAAVYTAGGAEEWGDLQWSPGQLRHVDEHPTQRCHLHFQGQFSYLVCTVHVYHTHSDAYRVSSLILYVQCMYTTPTLTPTGSALLSCMYSACIPHPL